MSGARLRRALITLLVVPPAALIVLIAVEALIARQQEGVPYEDPPRSPQVVGQGAVFDYVVMGDSTAVGQGGDYAQGIAVATARGLARGGRRVRLVNLAVGGATAEDIRLHQLGPAAGRRPDLVVIAVGANDVTHGRRPGRVREDLETTLDELVRANCDVRVVLTGSPELGAVRVAAQPLRGVLGLLGTWMNMRGIAPLEERPEVTLAPIARETGERFKEDETLFAADGFHPSTRGYATWVPVLERAIGEALSGTAERCRARPGPDEHQSP